MNQYPTTTSIATSSDLEQGAPSSNIKRRKDQKREFARAAAQDALGKNYAGPDVQKFKDRNPPGLHLQHIGDVAGRVLRKTAAAVALENALREFKAEVESE